MTSDEPGARTGLLGWEYRRTVLTLCVLALFVTVFGRLALSPLVPDIAAEYGTTNALIGATLTVMWLAYALTQFPSGMLADRYGDRLLIALSTGGTGVSALLLAVVPTFWLFAVGAVLIGGVAGFHYSVGTTLLTNIYDDTGMAIGIHNVGARSLGWPHPSSSRGPPSGTAGGPQSPSQPSSASRARS
jgi:MFS family permease